MRRIILVIIVLLVAGGVLYTVQASGGRSASLPQAAPAAPAAPARLPVLSTDAVVATADVLPVTSAELNFAAPGLVSAVLVSDGDSVKKDQVLVRLDSKRQAAAVTQAQATLDRVQSVQAAAQATLTRVQAVLAQLKAGPRPEDIATAVAVVNVAEAQLARAQAGATLPRSPWPKRTWRRRRAPCSRRRQPTTV